MINKYDYQVLQDIADLPDQYVSEDHCPPYINFHHVKYLHDLHLLDVFTLVPPLKEIENWGGLSGYRINAYGLSAMSDFEDKMAERRHQRIVDFIMILLAILALPNALNSAIHVIHTLFGK